MDYILLFVMAKNSLMAAGEKTMGIDGKTT
jgi:hypothetical protein